MSYEIHKLNAQLAILKDVEETYQTSSIGNCITQIESRIKHLKEHENE